jgi:phosphatidylethanolamine-binding protein (PEBP) family uncharacterized protein
MRRSPIACLPLALVSAVLLAGCGSSGRALREPDRSAVAPTRSVAASTSSTFAPTSLQLTADGFAPGAPIPPANACGGQAPGLHWSGVPQGTAEIAVGLVDFDEADEAKRIHWLVAGLPSSGTEGSLPPGGALPPTAVALTNGQGTPGYSGPCPAPGKTHTNNFVVFALPQASGLTAAVPGGEAYKQLEAAASGDIAFYTGTV